MNTIAITASNGVNDKDNKDADADRSLIIELPLSQIVVVVEKEHNWAALQQQVMEDSTRICDSSASTTFERSNASIIETSTGTSANTSTNDDIMATTILLPVSLLVVTTTMTSADDLDGLLYNIDSFIEEGDNQAAAILRPPNHPR